MARQFSWVLAAALACTVTPGLAASPSETVRSVAGGPQTPAGQKPSSGRGDRPEHPRMKWWEDAKWRAEIGMTAQQASQIKDIFETTMVQLRADRTELEKLEAALSLTIKDERSDIGIVTQQVDRVENLRAQMQKTRVLMLYRMHRVLSSEQRVRLQGMFEKLQAERRDPKRF